MKLLRQKKILELISDKICLTQEDLQNGLKEMGYDVTQSTVSRDIKELKLVKGRDEEGNYRYLATSSVSQNKKDKEYYHNLFFNTVKSVKYSLNNVVIKCDVGMASTACVALDELYSSMMLGSLAGDDTIFIVTIGEAEAKTLCENLNEML